MFGSSETYEEFANLCRHIGNVHLIRIITFGYLNPPLQNQSYIYVHAHIELRGAEQNQCHFFINLYYYAKSEFYS